MPRSDVRVRVLLRGLKSGQLLTGYQPARTHDKPGREHDSATAAIDWDVNRRDNFPAAASGASDGLAAVGPMQHQRTPHHAR